MLSSSLDHQGSLFVKLQKNITSGINNRTNTHNYKLKTQNDNKSFNKEGFTDTILNKKYTNVTDDYTQIQTELQDNNLNILKRLDPRTNPLLGKNITLNNAQTGYVTEQGIFKAYNPSTWADTPGKFGCPSAKKNMNVTVNETDQTNSAVPGYTFVTDNFPKLLVGQPMQSKTSCGAAGQNVYVNRLVDNPTATYTGCYSNSNSNLDSDSNKAMTNMGPLGYNACLKTAMNNGASYFGLSSSGKETNCLVSNDLTQIQQYGAPSAFTPVLQWESKTIGTTNTCRVTNDGRLIITSSESMDDPLFESNQAVASCANGGSFVDILATFGGNCDDKYNVKSGNASESIMTTYDSLNKPSNFSFLVNSENIGGNPADGCSKKAWDVSYLCGNVSKVDHISNASGKNVKFDCKSEVSACNFQFALKNNGNACLFQTDSGGNQVNKIWCALNDTPNLVPNSEFVAKNGKTGVNALKTGQALFADEWIGSNNGTLRMIMQADGNLCIYAYKSAKTCIKDKGAKINTMVGTENINAVYEVTTGGNKKVLGKIAYIDQDDVLHNYPTNSLKYSNEYTIFQNTDSSGNDLSTLPNSTIDQCKTACTNNDKCAGYAFESNANVCYLKNNNMYPKGDLSINNGITTGVRLPKVQSSASCSTTMKNISSEKYNHYVPGPELTADNMGNICNPFAANPISKSAKIKYGKINNNLETLGTQIMGGTEQLKAKTSANQIQFTKNQEKMLGSVKSYKDMFSNSGLKKTKKEGFNTNTVSSLPINMQDLERMKSDSELMVTHENMQYIYWMLVALSLVTVCMVVIKNHK